MMWKLMIKCSKLWNEKKDRHAISLSHTYLFKLKASMPHKLSLQAFNTRTVFLTKSNSNKHDSYMCTLSGNSRLFTCSTWPSISPSIRPRRSWDSWWLLAPPPEAAPGCPTVGDPWRTCSPQLLPLPLLKNRIKFSSKLPVLNIHETCLLSYVSAMYYSLSLINLIMLTLLFLPVPFFNSNTCFIFTQLIS